MTPFLKEMVTLHVAHNQCMKNFYDDLPRFASTTLPLKNQTVFHPSLHLKKGRPTLPHHSL
jgi:hypothetical protein